MKNNLVKCKSFNGHIQAEAEEAELLGVYGCQRVREIREGSKKKQSRKESSFLYKRKRS